jgi:uncharacterized RDD family membrane protein YckC
MSTQDNMGSPVMEACSVTGKMVPEDELVTFQGHRVCAEGKAILLERLKSGEAMPGESEKPTVLRRFLCMLLDVVILLVPLLIANVLVALQGSLALVGAVSLIGAVIRIIYYGQMHGSYGQTVGKMAGQLKVVNNCDSSPIGMGTGYVRSLAYAGPNIISALVIFVGNQLLISLAGIIIVVYFLVNVVVALADSNRQRALHDHIAGTRVIYIQ